MRERNPDFAKRVLKRDKECQVCGATKNLQAHHIIPFSVGGADTPENGEALCPDCHADRHLDVPRELFLRKKKRKHKTTRTCILIPDDLEQAAREKCRRLDLNLSQVVRQLLRQWIAADEEQEEADLAALKEHQEFEIEAGKRDEIAAWLL